MRNDGRNTSFSQRFAAFPAAILAAFALVAACVGAPAQALAESWESPQVSIRAQALTDATLHVVEQRTFDFGSDPIAPDEALTWTFWGFPGSSQVEVTSVRVVPVSAAGELAGDWQPFAAAPFNYEWRDQGAPDAATFSLDETWNTLYVSAEGLVGRVMAEIDYAVAGGVQPYEDVAEIYWKYVPESWPAQSENVTLHVQLPVPSGVEVEPGDNVRAWGHGPAGGAVSIGTDGVVAYSVPVVPEGQFAEARILFPTSWLTTLSAKMRAQAQGNLRLDEAVAEEAAYADTDTAFRIMDIAATLAVVGICIVALAVALVLYVRFGREHKPDLTAEYRTTVPAEGMNPALIGRLWRWNHESGDDVVAAVLHLVHTGAVRLEPAETGTAVDAGSRAIRENVTLVRAAAAERATDPVDCATLRLLFDELAEGKSCLALSAIARFRTDHPVEFERALERWQDQLSEQVARQDFFEPTGSSIARWMLLAAAVLGLAAVGSLAILRNVVFALIFAFTACSLVYIANYMPRRSVAGNNLAARCKALRNWLRDFPEARDLKPSDELFPYAFLFDELKPVPSAVAQLLAAFSLRKRGA